MRPNDALEPIMKYLVEHSFAAIPDDLHDPLYAIGRQSAGPIVCLVDLMEMGYARRDDLPAPVLRAAHMAALLVAQHGLFGKAESALKIADEISKEDAVAAMIAAEVSEDNGVPNSASAMPDPDPRFMRALPETSVSPRIAHRILAPERDAGNG